MLKQKKTMDFRIKNTQTHNLIYKCFHIPIKNTGLCLAIDGPISLYCSLLWYILENPGALDIILPPCQTEYLSKGFSVTSTSKSIVDLEPWSFW